jgi:MoxR-like ATPase
VAITHMTSVYTGKRQSKPDAPVHIRHPSSPALGDPACYRPDPGLVDAVNVALALGRPLLLTGEPGTGKTQLAYHVAWELGLEAPFVFETKSTSMARDLFYVYDTLGRFAAVQTGTSTGQPLDYMTYQALGQAILLSNPREIVENLVPAGFKHIGPTRSVVLIDEVDKAPRDFPNDILNELERLYFRIPELGNALVTASHDLAPIVVITSNSERNLPDAFLRRCVYFDVPFPDEAVLRDIIAARLGQSVRGTSALLDDALEVFFYLRAPERGLRKRPGTAELLDWLIILRGRQADANATLRDQGALGHATLSALLKTAEDAERGHRLFDEWRNE